MRGIHTLAIHCKNRLAVFPSPAGWGRKTANLFLQCNSLGHTLLYGLPVQQFAGPKRFVSFLPGQPSITPIITPFNGVKLIGGMMLDVVLVYASIRGPLTAAVAKREDASRGRAGDPIILYMCKEPHLEPIFSSSLNLCTYESRKLVISMFLLTW